MKWFADIPDFLTMHGYALYVWPAWIMTFGVLLIQVWQARKERRRLLKRLWQQQCVSLSTVAPPSLLTQSDEGRS